MCTMMVCLWVGYAQWYSGCRKPIQHKVFVPNIAYQSKIHLSLLETIWNLLTITVSDLIPKKETAGRMQNKDVPCIFHYTYTEAFLLEPWYCLALPWAFLLRELPLPQIYPEESSRTARNSSGRVRPIWGVFSQSCVFTEVSAEHICWFCAGTASSQNEEELCPCSFLQFMFGTWFQSFVGATQEKPIPVIYQPILTVISAVSGSCQICQKRMLKLWISFHIYIALKI